MCEVAVVSALYVALTFLSNTVGFAYGPIQFRVSEALVILVAFRRHLISFVPISCIIANLLSPYGAWDLLFMPVVSTIAALPIWFFYHRFSSPFMKFCTLTISSWSYAIITALGVGFMISVITKTPFWINTTPVLISQITIMTISAVLSGLPGLIGGKKRKL